MQTRLWSLTLGNFAIGTGVMVVPGMLNELGAGLSVTPAQVGLLISAFAMTICIGGPILAAATSAIERRTLLAGALALYAVLHLASAAAPGYDSLLAARMVTATGAALFTAQAAATAGLMVRPEVRGKAIASVFLGWSIAAVVGAPLGAWLGAHLGWRPTLALVGALSALLAVAVWVQIPRGLYVAAVNAAAWRALLGNRPLLLAVSVTAVQALGMFTVFSYMALLLKDFIGATPATISLLLLCFGATGVIGNVLGARYMDRLGAARVGVIAMSCMLCAILLWPTARGSAGVALALMLLWGLGCFAVNGSQQVRLVGMAPELASASVSLNSSAIYLGQAGGAFLGGLIIDAQGTRHLSYFGALPMAAAIALSLYAEGMLRRRTATETA